MLGIAPAESPQSPGPEVLDLVPRAIFMSASLRGFFLQPWILGNFLLHLRMHVLPYTGGSHLLFIERHVHRAHAPAGSLIQRM